MTRPDYKVHDPKGWCGDPARGAALGRRTIQDEPGDYAGVLYVEPVVLDGDYDCLGTYFGGGEDIKPRFWIANVELTVDYVITAKDRATAVEQARERWPNATIADASFDGELGDFVAGYIEAMLFSSTDGDDVPLDRDHTRDDFDAENLAAIERDCRAFLAANRADCTGDHTPGSVSDTATNHAGRDFWYTRVGHGCGFWDGDWPNDAGKRLTAASKAVGEAYVEVGDDGKLHYT